MGGVRLDEALDAVLYRRRGYFRQACEIWIMAAQWSSM